MLGHPAQDLHFHMLVSAKTFPVCDLACFEVRWFAPERLMVLRIFFDRALPVKIELFLLNKSEAHPF